MGVGYSWTTVRHYLGYADYGGDSSSVQDDPHPVSAKSFCTQCFWFERGRAVVTWDFGGGDSSAVASSLHLVLPKSSQLRMPWRHLEDGSTYLGSSSEGGNFSSTSNKLSSLLALPIHLRMTFISQAPFTSQLQHPPMVVRLFSLRLSITAATQPPSPPTVLQWSP